MTLEKLSNEELAGKLANLKTHLEPVLNLESKKILNELERRLGGGKIPAIEKFTLKKQPAKKMTKKQLVEYFLAGPHKRRR